MGSAPVFVKSPGKLIGMYTNNYLVKVYSFQQGRTSLVNYKENGKFVEDISRTTDLSTYSESFL